MREGITGDFLLGLSHANMGLSVACNTNMNWHTCWLAGHGKCGGGIDRHHLLSKGKFIGVKKNKAFKDSLRLLLVPVCNAHNAYTKQADCKWARKILLEKLIDERGLEYVERAVDQVLSKVKVRSNYSDMEIDAILSTKPRSGLLGAVRDKL